jgi:hypothetical protein
MPTSRGNKINTSHKVPRPGPRIAGAARGDIRCALNRLTLSVLPVVANPSDLDLAATIWSDISTLCGRKGLVRSLTEKPDRR